MTLRAVNPPRHHPLYNDDAGPEYPRIDRLARNLSEGLRTIEELHAQSIHIRSLAEKLDTSDDSPNARLMLHMLLSLAEWERGTIRDRIRAGVDRAAAG